jgi:hypothetical protein
MHCADWLNLFMHYLFFSLLSVGGPTTTTPEMHRYLVYQQHWLSEAQFNSSIAIAQSAPGPNVLFGGHRCCSAWRTDHHDRPSAALFGALLSNRSMGTQEP